ncbi:cytosine permease [Planosporangium flavigriseum]|uniref:Transporter membrane subunit n=1 Tax=Planosporangium flavigriseum TaxID=373681 RepID=A0A8J3LYR9_9ACTN|nr:cytosine permease [Planosporangium flavigriseum]NJC65709.1 cytosine permease [Planosporangium flavigriseum]GIG73560.1 transporter membrane subunit [Planosporangium flavigriseum]
MSELPRSSELRSPHSGSSATTATTAPIRGIESRSIDYVPASERHGRLSDQATIWFAGSAQLLSLSTGAIGIWSGLNLFWTLIALAVGTIIGTIPVAAHASQGPHLGLPQMVQSRPQFGRYGSMFIWAVAVLVYWGYVVFGVNTMGATAHQLGMGPSWLWIVVLGIVATVFAIYGYDWLHVGQRIVTVLLVIALLVFTVGAAVGGHIPAGQLSASGTFDLTKFLIVASAAAVYQLSWAFFVSDYSRYMPAHTSHRSIIAYTALGAGLGVYWMEALGAIAAAVFPDAGLTGALQDASDQVFNGLGAIVLILGGISLAIFTGMCIYGGSLTLISAADSVKPVSATRAIRMVTILLIAITATVVGLFIPDDFLNGTFYTVLAVLGYLMAPWTAINLVDYFLVRKNRYSVREIFNPAGMYGRWNWRGLTAYWISFAVMIPFMYLSFFHGFIANALNGVDLAFFVGIPVAGVLYWLLCRSLDVQREWRIIPEADRDLDAVAKPVE